MMTGIAFWILSSDRSSTATAVARSSPYLINEATDSLPINIRKMALGLWRLTSKLASKQRPCTYKSGDLTVQRQLVRNKIPMTLLETIIKKYKKSFEKVLDRIGYIM